MAEACKEVCRILREMGECSNSCEWDAGYAVQCIVQSVVQGACVVSSVMRQLTSTPRALDFIFSAPCFLSSDRSHLLDCQLKI